MSSSDGFCSCLSFSPGELGQTHPGPIHSKHQHHNSMSLPSSSSATSTPTPNQTAVPVMSRQVSSGNMHSLPSPFSAARPSSPTQPTSASSANTQTSTAVLPDQNNITTSGPAPSVGTIPSVSASSASSSITGPNNTAGVPLFTPPQTPMAGQGGAGGSHSATSSVSGVTGPPLKRESESERDEPVRKSQQQESQRKSHQRSHHRKRESECETSENEMCETSPEERREPAVKKRRVVPTLLTNKCNEEGKKDDDGDANSKGS